MKLGYSKSTLKVINPSASFHSALRPAVPVREGGPLAVEGLGGEGARGLSSSAFTIQRLGFYARTVAVRLTYFNMKTLTRSVNGEATDRASEIFMKAFEQLRLQVRGGMIVPVRLIA